jgi:hypothetical protein
MSDLTDLTVTEFYWLKLTGSSNISVTRAAIGERSDLVKVMWAKSGCPFRDSTTATTPS